MTGNRCLVGLAMYRQGEYNFHWALTVHDRSWAAPDVHVYQIVNRTNTGFPCSWRTLHLRSDLTRLGTLAGVFQVDASDHAILDIDRELWRLPAVPNGYDFSRFAAMWTGAVWVIKALHRLSERGAIRLPCSVEELYAYVLLRTPLLTGPSPPNVVKFPIPAPPYNFAKSPQHDVIPRRKYTSPCDHKLCRSPLSTLPGVCAQCNARVDAPSQDAVVLH